jgi:hypothetical protein
MDKKFWAPAGPGIQGACRRLGISLRQEKMRPMFADDYFVLGLFRLKTSEEWLSQGHSFSFLFPKEGRGKFFSAARDHPLASGDVLVFSEEQGGKVSAMDAGELVCWHFSVCL